MKKLLVNRGAEERNNLVLLHNLLHRIVQVAYLTIEKSNGKVFRPLARAEDPKDADNDG